MDCNNIVINNIEEYTQQIIDGKLILKRTIPIIDANSLFKKKIIGSKIIKCRINNCVKDIKKYKELLLYLLFNNLENDLLQDSYLNYTNENLNERGFTYYSKIGKSIQGSNTIMTLKEIIRVIEKLENYSLELQIKLDNNEKYTIII